jgi:hypothetical protein
MPESAFILFVGGSSCWNLDSRRANARVVGAVPLAFRQGSPGPFAVSVRQRLPGVATCRPDRSDPCRCAKSSGSSRGGLLAWNGDQPVGEN